MLKIAVIFIQVAELCINWMPETIFVMSGTDGITIQHAPERFRIWAEVEGSTAYVEYSIHDGTLDILHTVVPKPIEGRGIASSLVEYAYSYAVGNGLKPAATCRYAKAWLLRHPDILH